jgi:NAD(P)-dependent dehydrogenase (short-subunit alcohol dehydrogenase family)/acyl dehydratase
MHETQAAARVRFTPDDLDLFARASHDSNPLHLSDAYARKTPYGERVVFGALGALACLARLRERPASVVAQLTAEFASPMFVGVDYEVDLLEDSAERARVVLRDGRQTLLKLDVVYREGRHAPFPGDEAEAPLREARDRQKAELAKDMVVEGSWAPRADAFRRLRERYRCAGKGGDERQQAALLWASYFAGMDLPGKRALFSRLTLQFTPGGVPAAPRLTYRAQVKSVHAGLNLLRAAVALAAGGQELATGEVASFVREDTLAVPDAEWGRLLPPGDALRGKVGLVTGASRGLGAAIAQALCLQGCTVLANYAKSTAEAERLRQRLADAPGRVVLEQGDAGDPAWCAAVQGRVGREYGRLDFLVCNACPPLLPSWLEPPAVRRVGEHLAQSVALVLTPMAAFLKTLAESKGCSVFISSSAVTRPVAVWPHYVSAKCALEGLVRVAALEYSDVRFLVVRPPRLLTDLTNTPLGRVGALSPARVAGKLVARLAGGELGPDAAGDGNVAYLEDF